MKKKTENWFELVVKSVSVIQGFTDQDVTVNVMTQIVFMVDALTDAYITMTWTRSVFGIISVSVTTVGLVNTAQHLQNVSNPR